MWAFCRSCRNDERRGGEARMKTDAADVADDQDLRERIKIDPNIQLD